MTETPVNAPAPVKRRTWLWILLAMLGLCVIGVIAIAGAGLYFVSSHVSSKTMTTADAFKEFDAARAPFKDTKPVFEIDARERPRQMRKLSDFPTASKRAEQVRVMVFDDDRGKLVKLSLPFWLLRMGKQKIDLADEAFDFQQLDVKELERVGSILLLDERGRGGQRVLIWTQ